MDERHPQQRLTPTGARRLSLGLLAAFGLLASGIVIVLAIPRPLPPHPSPTAPDLAGAQTAVASSTVEPAGSLPSGSPRPAPTDGPPRTPQPAATSAPPQATATPTPGATLPTDATLEDALARCPTAAEIAFIDARVPLTFAADPTAPDLVCRASDGSADLTRLQERAYQGLLTLRRIPFDAPLPWTARSLFAWFTHAVKGVYFDGGALDSYCCGFPGVIVIRSAPDIGYLTDNHWRNGLDSLVSLLVHEARHAEGYLHDCNASDKHGDAIDDRTLEQMGAWGLQYWLDRWLAEHAGSPYMTPSGATADEYRQSLEDGADFILHYRICEPPAA